MGFISFMILSITGVILVVSSFIWIFGLKLNGKTYLKRTITIVPIFVSIAIGIVYFSYKNLIKVNPTGVIELGTLSHLLLGNTVLFIIVSVIWLMGWFIFGFILMLKKFFTKMIIHSDK